MKTDRGAPSDRWLVGVCIFALAYAVIALVFTRKGTPLPPDSGQYAQVARSLVEGHGYTINMTEFHPGLLASLRHPPELHGLLEPFFIAPLFFLFGPHESLVRIPFVLLLSCLAVMTFLCARRPFGNVAGCLAAVLVLARPSFALHALVGDDGVAAAVFSLGSFLCLRNGVESGRGLRWFLGAGLLAGLGTLQKFSGIAVPFVFVVAVLADSNLRRAVTLRHWPSIFVPVGFAVGVYAFRNYVVHGGLGFRFSPIDWLSKDHGMAYFAFYAQAPSLSDVFAQLGVERVFQLIAKEARTLGKVILEDPVLMIGGLVALWPLRQHKMFVAFVLAYSVAMWVFVCVLYHVEARYLAPLVPFYAVAVSGVLSIAGRALLRRVRAPVLGRWVSVSVLVLGASTVSFPAMKMIYRIGRAMGGEPQCAETVRFLRATVDSSAAILTANPWFVSWTTERPAVMVPTNGDAAVLTVVNHYATDWAVAGATAVYAADLAFILSQPGLIKTQLNPELAFSDDVCSVYRLRRSAR